MARRRLENHHGFESCRQSIYRDGIYFKGALRRTDWSDPNGNHKQVEVVDGGSRRLTVWDFDARQYTVQRFNRPRVAAKSFPPARVIRIDRATTDTGDRRAFFGRTARHLITREHDSRTGEETLVDGWYMDSEGLPSIRRDAVLLVYLAGQTWPPVLEVNQRGPMPTGLAVLLKKTSAHEETTSEVTELVEGVLPDHLFEPPSGFKRVIQFPRGSSISWSDQLRLTWEWLQDWVESLFP